MIRILIACALVCVVGCNRSRSDKEALPQYYDFRIGHENAGYFAITDTGSEVAMIAMFTLQGETSENPFGYRYTGDRVTAYRTGARDWTTMPPGDNRFPTSAYPLLLRGLAEQRTYLAINEGTGENLGETELVRVDDVVTESRKGRTIRVFHLDAKGRIAVIDWGGGATSTLRADKREACAGSPFASAVSRSPGR